MFLNDCPAVIPVPAPAVVPAPATIEPVGSINAPVKGFVAVEAKEGPVANAVLFGIELKPPAELAKPPPLTPPKQVQFF